MFNYFYRRRVMGMWKLVFPEENGKISFKVITKRFWINLTYDKQKKSFKVGGGTYKISYNGYTEKVVFGGNKKIRGVSSTYAYNNIGNTFSFSGNMQDGSPIDEIWVKAAKEKDISLLAGNVFIPNLSGGV